MFPPWNSSHGYTSGTYQRKYIINEAYRQRLIVKRRPDTELERIFMKLKYEATKDLVRRDMDWRQQTIESLDIHYDVPIEPEEAVAANETYSVKPQRGRQLLLIINGELWASARWLYFNLEYSIGFDSLTSWLSKYRGCVRRKITPDGHVWLHHVGDFKNWRKKSVELLVRQEAVKAQMGGSRP